MSLLYYTMLRDLGSWVLVCLLLSLIEKSLFPLDGSNAIPGLGKIVSCCIDAKGDFGPISSFVLRAISLCTFATAAQVSSIPIVDDNDSLLDIYCRR